ncbi:MAG: hypothetical protein P1P84_04510 [Deferrisomatales bacterium]|nr:hypothetical protein [Deferrisomatales bacterium]
MDDHNRTEERAQYNLEGGPRHVVVKHGVVKAVAPGLRLVKATEEEAQPFRDREIDREPPDYGIPV